MDMIGRYTKIIKDYLVSGDIPYADRKRIYFANLRYWNHMIDSKKIDVVLMNHEPHQGYDYVLYGLCKQKGIPILYLSRLFTMDGLYISEDWEDPAPELQNALQRLGKEYANPERPISLSENYEYYFNFFRKEKPTLWYMGKKNVYTTTSFIQKWWRKALKVLRKDPRRFAASMFSTQFWSRKLRQHRALLFYNQHALEPDFSQSYIYVPLHMQPEATTLPLAGAFSEQERIVQLLAAHLPPEVRIYVKDHPSQGEGWRSEDFYRILLSIPSVTLIPKETDTHVLLDRCLAVASASGTVIFEASLRQKPSLMFGHFVWQYGPGVHRIRTSDDCHRAVQDILTHKESHTERDVRLFLKGLEETATPYPGFPESPVDNLTGEQKMEMVGALFERRILAALKTSAAPREQRMPPSSPEGPATIPPR